MKEYLITSEQAGIKLMRFLTRALPGAGQGLLRSQLRKKNININKKKADGSEILVEGDRIQVFFSDETILRFEGREPGGEDFAAAMNAAGGDRGRFTGSRTTGGRTTGGGISTGDAASRARVLYEDEDILALDKDAGVLSQPDSSGRLSMNDILLAFLLERGSVTEESLRIVRPSVCNRLDMNTSGIVLCGKTMEGLKYLSGALRDRQVGKYYLCLVKGFFDMEGEIRGYITKDRAKNISRFTKEAVSPESKEVGTVYERVEEINSKGERLTLVRARLLTGRAHQIRAQLSALGYPIAGDVKYGDASFNKKMHRLWGTDRQLLHAARVVLPGRCDISSPLPEDIDRICR